MAHIKVAVGAGEFAGHVGKRRSKSRRKLCESGDRYRQPLSLKGGQQLRHCSGRTPQRFTLSPDRTADQSRGNIKQCVQKGVRVLTQYPIPSS